MKLRYILSSIGMAWMLCGCGSFLEEYSQDKDYITSWKNLDELLIGDCYLPVNNIKQYKFFSNPGMFLHLLADEMEENNLGDGNKSVEPESHQYMFGPSTWQPRMGATENGLTFYSENREWTLFYKYINVANNVVESAKKLPQVTPDEIQGFNKVTGEAKFLRAFYYFWLLNVYGQPYDPATASTALGIPMKMTPEIQDRIFSRQTVGECYDLIVKDLLEAEQCLAKVPSQKKLYRADVTAVRLLLARVYLYMQKWEEAARYAQLVVEAHPVLENVVKSGSKFMRADNPENIFSMGGNDLVRMTSFYYQSTRISTGLYESYHENDVRRSSWFWRSGSFIACIRENHGAPLSNVPETDKSWYYDAYIYGSSSMRTPVSSLFWLRSAEAYLILAEAKAYTGEEEEAQQALKQLVSNRYREGAPERNVESLSGSDLITRIRTERRWEFPVEGHRWFDLRRYRVCQVQPEKVSLQHTYTVYRDNDTGDFLETRLYTLTEEDASWTVNIPHEVLEFNTGMPGNGNQDRPYTIVPTMP